MPKRLIALFIIVLFAVSLIDSYLVFKLFFYVCDYKPTSFLTWLNLLPDMALNQKSLITLIQTQGLLIILPGLLFVYRSIGNDSSKALGDAHFASFFEIIKAGFSKKQDESLIIGKKYGMPLYVNGFEHVLCFAPTGSGKTRSIAIPNLLHFPYSIVCNDVKLTLYDKTSKYRQRQFGNKIFLWAPGEDETDCFNPLSLISEDTNKRIRDIQRLAHIFIPDTKSDPIWTQASRKLFKTLLLYLLDTPEKPTTLGEINRMIKQDHFDDWLLKKLEETNHLDRSFYENGFSYHQNHEKTRASILETFSGYFELFDDPIVDKATSKTDFDITKLRSEKMTIYIGFSDDDMERLAPIINCFWQQFISSMIQKVPDLNREPYPVLCLIDEFASLGRIERLRRSLKLLREYRVRCLLMMQYLAQAKEHYTDHEAKAFTNIKTKIAFATDDYQDAEFISKLLGNRTERIVNDSHSVQYRGNSRTNSSHFQSVPLMRPEEVMKIKEYKAIVLKTGVSAFFIKKCSSS
jgi:type IV secretion system protein VirD4